jgi:hypothetical protein
MRLYLNHLRPALRQTLAATLPGPRWASRRIAVSGLPRSGTSWVAKALSRAPGVSYYFEPDSVLGGDYWNRYLAAGTNAPTLERSLGDAFCGRVHTEYVLAEQGFREIVTAWQAETVLVKWVKLVLSLDWFAQQFPDVTVVQTIRHPVPLALSWRPRGWDPGHHLGLMLAQPALMEGPLRQHADTMREAETFWQKTGAFWGAVSLMQLRQHRPGWVLREHEWYCMDPEARLRDLVSQVGLRWTDEVGRFVSGEDRGATGPGYGRHRDPRQEVHKWEKHITRAEFDELETVVRSFDLPFYRGLDPEAFWNPSSP